ncbi:unnamed protein product [Trifolium pratense]|uniref:Uncharacterized protein n=1 Tax=Trifolium pratense TaxID=57577 RepID=A0ACB0LGA1_TRIPR|nr:unnamed protein product [Trifolium pratense]
MERRTSQVSLREKQEVEKRIQPRQGFSGYVFMVELSAKLRSDCDTGKGLSSLVLVFLFYCKCIILENNFY